MSFGPRTREATSEAHSTKLGSADAIPWLAYGGAFFTVNNVKSPSKLIVGPSTHCAWAMVESMTGFDISVEEHRFFDVRRWKQGMTYFNTPIHKVQITKNPDGTLSYNYPKWEDRDFKEFQDFLPIPQSEMDKNGKLTQNPGY